MKTSRGIYNDISESDYCFNYNQLKFYFSSMSYMKKFEEKINTYIKNESFKLMNRYNTNFDFVLFLSLSLYRKIEKRGFNVLYLDETLNKYIPLVNYKLKEVVENGN